jgi:hypothetical protein
MTFAVQASYKHQDAEQGPTCDTAWETGPLAAERASLTGSGRLAEAASAAELAAPAVALRLSCRYVQTCAECFVGQKCSVCLLQNVENPITGCHL